jgi:hypothetical protein
MVCKHKVVYRKRSGWAEVIWEVCCQCGQRERIHFLNEDLEKVKLGENA